MGRHLTQELCHRHPTACQPLSAGNEPSPALSPAWSPAWSPPPQSKGVPAQLQVPESALIICTAIAFNKTSQSFCHKPLQTQTSTGQIAHPTAVQGVFASICLLPLRVQWHAPHRISCQPLPFRLERHREGTASQGLSHTAQPAHRHSLLTGAGKQHRLHRARETAHKPPGKTQLCLTSHPLEAAPSLPQELGTDRDSPALVPVLQGGLASTPQHPQRGPSMSTLLRARLQRGLCQPTAATSTCRLTKGRTRRVCTSNTRTTTFGQSHSVSTAPAPAPGCTDPHPHSQWGGTSSNPAFCTPAETFTCLEKAKCQTRHTEACGFTKNAHSHCKARGIPQYTPQAPPSLQQDQRVPGNPF